LKDHLDIITQNVTAKTDFYKLSFFPRAVFHWNNLSPNIVDYPTLEQLNQAFSISTLQIMLKRELILSFRHWSWM